MLTKPFFLASSILLLVFGLMQYQLWFEHGGIQDYHRELALVAEQMKINQQAHFENAALAMQIKRIQKSHYAAEMYAREELGMIKQDETFYQIVQQ